VELRPPHTPNSFITHLRSKPKRRVEIQHHPPRSRSTNPILHRRPVRLAHRRKLRHTRNKIMGRHRRRRNNPTQHDPNTRTRRQSPQTLPNNQPVRPQRLRRRRARNRPRTKPNPTTQRPSRISRSLPITCTPQSNPRHQR